MSGYKQGACPNCPSSDAFTEYENGSFKCFSCGYKGNSGLTLEGLKSSLNREKNKPSGPVNLPSDFDYFLPKIATDWLWKYALNQKEIQRSKIGWSDKKQTLIFPVFEQGELLMYQSRYFGDDPKQPKYKTVGYRQDIIYLPDPRPDSTTVIVEDIISAIKVSRVMNCMPIFGSDIGLPLALRLARTFTKARIWLDPNMKQKSLKTALMLSELGLPTTVIFSDLDPKEYCTADIRMMVDPLGE